MHMHRGRQLGNRCKAFTLHVYKKKMTYDIDDG
jgi:hypothetical protein